MSVTVTPGAKQERVERLPDGGLRVAVAAPARDGRANEAVVRAVARFLGVPVTRVRLVRGARGRHKIMEISEAPS